MRAFKDMNIRIKDPSETKIPLKIQEDPQENAHPSPHSSKKFNQDWTDIMSKTRSLEQNLLMLRNSINNNLMKITKSKLEQDSKKLSHNPSASHLNKNDPVLVPAQVKVLGNYSTFFMGKKESESN